MEQYREYLQSEDPARRAALEIEQILASGSDEDSELLLAAMNCLKKKAIPVTFFGENLRKKH